MLEEVRPTAAFHFLAGLKSDPLSLRETLSLDSGPLFWKMGVLSITKCYSLKVGLTSLPALVV